MGTQSELRVLGFESGFQQIELSFIGFIQWLVNRNSLQESFQKLQIIPHSKYLVFIQIVV